MHQLSPSSLKFPMHNGMYSIKVLAKHLDTLVKNKQIQAWHPGPWVDWRHLEIEIGFDSLADAQRVELERGKW